MKYFVITDVDNEEAKAVIFHDYSRQYFSVHSISDALQLAIDSAVRVLKGSRLVKTSDKILKVLNFDINSPFWVPTITKKVVGDGSFWKLSEEGNLLDIAEIDGFLEKTLH